jgi:hypothetical protein
MIIVIQCLCVIYLQHSNWLVLLVLLSFIHSIDYHHVGQIKLNLALAGMSLEIVPWLGTSDGLAHLEFLAISSLVTTAGQSTLSLSLDVYASSED